MTFNKSSSSNEYDYLKYVLQLNGKLSTLFNKKRHKSPDIINPFIYPWDIPWYQWIKMISMTFVLIPLRLVGFLVSFSLSYLLCFIATVGESSSERTKPMCGWRRNIIMPIFHVFARSAYFFSSLQWIKVKGTKCSREDAPILVLAPHSAFMDSLVVVYLDMNSVVGKTETANSLIGYFLRMTQPMLVTREDPNSRQNTVDQIVRRAKSDEDWPQMLIFPEGTCTNRSCLINFKTGAFIPGCPIQPVVLRWPNQVDSITWTWEGPGVWTLVWMLFTQFHTYLEIEFLPVYRPSHEEKINPKLFADNVRNVMAKALNIPTTNHSYEDCRHITLAKKHGLPFSEIIVEFSRLFKRIIAQYTNTKDMLDKLLDTAITHDEFMSVHELCRHISMTDCEVLIKRVFKFYDKENIGKINFKRFFCHLTLYALPFERKLALEYILKAFKINDAHSDSIMSQLLEESFMLSSEEAEEIIAYTKSKQSETQSFTEILDSILNAIGEPFYMYEDYQKEYNKSTKQTLSSESVSTTTQDYDNTNKSKQA